MINTFESICHINFKSHAFNVFFIVRYNGISNNTTSTVSSSSGSGVSNLESSRKYQSAPDLMYQEYLEQGLSRSKRTMSLCLRKSSIAVARRTLGRNNSVATQSDLGVSCRRDSRDHGSRRGSRDQSWSGATYEEVVRSSYHVPVTVKTMELRHRENKDKIKIR